MTIDPLTNPPGPAVGTPGEPPEVPEPTDPDLPDPGIPEPDLPDPELPEPDGEPALV